MHNTPVSQPKSQRGGMAESSKVKFGLELVFFAKLVRCCSDYFFENVLEMTLAGKTKIIADFADTFVGEGQQPFSFLYFAVLDEGMQLHSRFFVEFMGEIGTVEPQFFCDRVHIQRLIDMALDVMDNLPNVRVAQKREAMLGHFRSERMDGFHLQRKNMVRIRQLLGLFYVKIRELESNLRFHTCLNSCSSEKSDGHDEGVLELTDIVICYSAHLHMHRRFEKSVEALKVSIRDKRKN